MFIMTVHGHSQEETPDEIKLKHPEGCLQAYNFADYLYKEKWQELASFINFPLQREFPLSQVTKEQYLKNPKLFFDRGIIEKPINIKKVGSKGCMIAQGLIWFNVDQQEGKLKRINYLSQAAKNEIEIKNQPYLKDLPSKWQDAKIALTCSTTKSTYNVFKKNKSREYILVKKVKDKVTDVVPEGQMRVEGSLGVKYYRFTQDKTTLTLSESMSRGGYTIEAKKGEQVLYVPCS
tara:strand:+ start:6592 stop:7293 length:702 start_codon:yes stop_codon:yes gene_type:complete